MLGSSVLKLRTQAKIHDVVFISYRLIPFAGSPVLWPFLLVFESFSAVVSIYRRDESPSRNRPPTGDGNSCQYSMHLPKLWMLASGRF
jgi:hypothetical protein